MLPIDPATDCDSVKGVTRTAIFKAGTVNKALSTFVFPDATAEADESYTIVLANPLGATVRKGTAVIRIVNDD